MTQNSLKIAKWGNGQGIRLPMAVMKLLSLKAGDELQMKVQNETIVLVPKKEKKLTLAERFANYVFMNLRNSIKTKMKRLNISK